MAGAGEAVPGAAGGGRGRPWPTAARYAVRAPEPPPLQAALRLGERLRRAAMGLGRELLGSAGLPPELSGHGEAASEHRHAFWLPEPDGAGRISGVLVHAPGGLGREAMRVLARLSWVRWGRGGRLRLELEAIGPLARFAGQSPLCGRSVAWRSLTPYLRPWHLKRRETRSRESLAAALEAQVRREWALRGEGLPPLARVEASPLAPPREQGWRARDVLRRRGEAEAGRREQPDRIGQMLRLVFRQPVEGPLALGFGCHFGLGVFVPCSGSGERSRPDAGTAPPSAASEDGADAADGIGTPGAAADVG